MTDGTRKHQNEYSPFANATGAAGARRTTCGPDGRSPWTSREVEGFSPDSLDVAPDAGGWPHESELDEAPDGAGDRPTHNPACTRSGIGIRGADDRRPVADSLVIPCRWICQLWIRQRDSNGRVTESGATGVLVSPRHVLTVAHAISGSERDDRNQLVTHEAIAIRVTPARDGSNRPFGTVDAKLPARLSPGWSARTMPPHQDYALLTLDKPIGDATFKALAGAKLCYWGAKSCGHRAIATRVPPETLQGVTAFTAGYPKDRGNGERPMRATGILSHVVRTSRLMQYSADACQGQSGSPVWVAADGERRLVGLLVRVLPTTTLALRVTREMCAQLRQWLGKDSEAFREEVVAARTVAPNAEEWGEYGGEYGGEADSETGAWIDARSSCACRRESAATEAEWDGAGGREAETHEEESYEEPASEDEAPYAEWGVAEEDEEGGGWTSLGEDEGVIAPPEPTSRYARTASWGEVGDVEAPEQQVVTPPPTLRLLPFMSDLAAPLDPGFYNASGQYQTTPALQTCVDDVGKLRSARGVQIALVDLSSGVGSPAFAGVRHTTQVALGSVGKIAPMYAAFQLQAELRRLRVATGAATAADLWAAARARWTATQTPPSGAAVTAITGDLGRKADLMTWKSRPIDLPRGSTLPNLQEIFGDDVAVNIRSVAVSYVGTANACDEFAVLLRREHADTGGKRDLAFMQRMRMMVGLSDNSAAGSCIDDLGSAYVASLMVQSGLWHPERGGGIWLFGNYAGRTWRKSPLGGAVQNGTAGAVAAFMTLLAQDRLVDAAASSAMRAILLKRAYPGAGTRSPVQQALESIPGRASKVHSKLGLLPGVVSDAAIVERTEGGKHLHYAVAVLNAPGNAAMTEIAVALDNCIRRANGLP